MKHESPEEIRATLARLRRELEAAGVDVDAMMAEQAKREAELPRPIPEDEEARAFKREMQLWLSACKEDYFGEF